MSLESDFLRFQKNALERFVRIKKKAAFGLFGAIILDTPVLKGVLRNNWFIEFDSIPLKLTDVGDPSGSGVVSRIESDLGKTNLNNSIYFVNNLPYVRPIEFDGYSGKAPEGMLRVNVARWQDIVSEATRTTP